MSKFLIGGFLAKMTTEKTDFCKKRDTIIGVVDALLSLLFRIHIKSLTARIVSPTIYSLLLLSVTSCTNSNTTNGNNNTEKSSIIDTIKSSKHVHQIIYGIDVDSLDHENYSVKNGENLSDILTRYNIDKKHIAKCDSAISKVFDIKKLRAGNNYCVITEQDSLHTLRHLIYDISPIEYFILSINGDNVTSLKNRHKVIERERVAEGVIETSLWNAVVGQGLQWELAMKLSDIYAWNIDFFGLQKGDMFKAKYTERWVDTTFVGIDSIKCAMFYHDNREYHAIPFDINGKTEYFDNDGNSLRKAFLKAPLRYSRISSKFTHSRFHPVLKISRPHHGVDYAAPKGTPVMSIGDGKVVAKGWDKKGGGNYIRIQHNSVYSTVYMHLNGFAKGISQGSNIKQSDLIGYVGSTGTATGPHLDFRVYKNGRPIDPLKLESPSVEPVPSDSMAKFTVKRDFLLKDLRID